MSKILDDRYYLAAAYHEAGHALAALSTGHRDITAWLEPYPICVGRTSSTGPVPRDMALSVHRRWAQDLMMVELAGHASECLYWSTLPPAARPASIQNFQGDLDRAAALAGQLHADPKAKQREEDAAFDRAALFLAQPTNQSILRTVAQSLFDGKKLSDIELRQLCAGFVAPAEPTL